MEAISATTYSTSTKKHKSYPVRIIIPSTSSKLSERDIKRTGEKRSQPVRITELLGLQSVRGIQQHSIKNQSRRRAEPERLKGAFNESVAREAAATRDKRVRRVLQFDEEDARDTQPKQMQSGNPSNGYLREQKQQNAENRYSRIPTRMSSKKPLQNSTVVQRSVTVQKENKNITQKGYQLRTTTVRKLINSTNSVRRESQKNVKRASKSYNPISQRGIAEKLKKEKPVTKHPTSRLDTRISGVQPSLELLLSGLRKITNDQDPCSCDWALIASLAQEILKKKTQSKTKIDDLPIDRKASYVELQAGLQRVLCTMEENVTTVRIILARVSDALSPSIPQEPHSSSEPATNADLKRVTVPCEKEVEHKEVEQPCPTPMQTD